MKCLNCGREFEHDVHFCPWCGISLEMSKILSSENVRLTFLRADLSKFTAMCELMTAEDVMAFLNEIFGVFSMIIESYKGVIYQVIGDEIVGIFGHQKGSGFAPHMTIMAAEEMIGKLLEFNKKGYLKNPIGLKLGSEIESASIFNIGGGLHDAFIISEGFKKSQILQKNAASNTMLVGENLYQETKAFFNYHEVGEFVEDSFSVKAYEYKVKAKK